MENYATNLDHNPMLYIGYLLSAVAAIGTVLFIAGFFGGITHLFSYSESADHMDHARTRSLWGIYLCMAALGIWEFIRVILGEAPASSTLVLVLILLSPVWIPWLRNLFTGASGGH